MGWTLAGWADVTAADTIEVSTYYQNFSGTAGGANPPGQTVTVTNGAGTPMAWYAQPQAPWVSLSAISGTTPTTITVTPLLHVNESWVNNNITATGAPTGRYGHSVVWTGNQMIVWSGVASTGYTNTGGIYTPATNTWTTLTTTGAPTARMGHSAVWDANAKKMLIWGGFSGSTYLSGVYAYSLTTNSWSQMAAGGEPSPTYGHSTVWTGTQMVVWGGQAQWGITNQGAIFDPYGLWGPTWTPLSSTSAPSARMEHTAVISSYEMIIWGGYDGAQCLNDGARLNLNTLQWSPCTVTRISAPTARRRHSAVVIGNQMIVWGGLAPTAVTNTGAVYNIDTDTWQKTTTTSASPVARHGHTAISTGAAMLVWGGQNSAATPLRNGGTYTPLWDLAGGTYNSGFTVFAPTATNLPQGVSTNIVVTGQNAAVIPGVQYFTSAQGATPPNQTAQLRNTGYGANTNAWTAYTSPSWLQITPTSGGAMSTNVGANLSVSVTSHPSEKWGSVTTTTSGPAARAQHVAVWTGTKMLLWGGLLASADTNSGRIYDPASNTWAAMSATGAPSARHSASAVWTGTQMIVWGGQAGATYTNDGAAYNPTTNTWSAITSAAAPTARMGHAAVWTGSKMVVWGGLDGAGVLNTGGIYNPATGSWDGATDVWTAPAARYAHSAVWTGKCMIVWQGINAAGVPFSDGKLFDPENNRWSYMSSVGAPAARAFHSAVWTGSQMIVWGGANGATSYNTGGLYDPVTNTWTGATTTVSAQAARYAHTAVWTGYEMIVWGGRNSAAAVQNNGKFYSPDFILPEGIHTGWVTITGATSAKQTLHVVYNVGNPKGKMFSYPLTLTYTAPFAGPSTPTVRQNYLYNQLNGQINWTGQATAPWVSFTPTSGTIYNGGANLIGISAVTAPPEGWRPYGDTPDGPGGRLGHTAVWTGTKMIIWGGQDSQGTLRSGRIFDPLTNRWTPTSIANAPSHRAFHSAVWTGARMIVFGGIDGTLPSSQDTRADGGIYDPANDTWTAISTVGATPRKYHACVWTGTQMIVWGGQNQADSTLNSGAAYDPATGAWTTISQTNAPTPRNGPVGVWTGSKMIVWGGWDTTLGSFTNTGAQYDPVNNAWSPIPNTGAPISRGFGFAVWTGNRMLVWGGQTVTNGTFTNTGGYYDPATQTWSTLSTLPSTPTARAFASGVWTGTTLMLWGGWPTNAPANPLNEGFYYYPGGALPSGHYEAAISMVDPNAINSPQTWLATLDIAAPAPGTIALSTTNLTFVPNSLSDPAPQTVTLSNSGGVGTQLNWTATSDSYWLKVTPTTGTTDLTPATLTITASLGHSDHWLGTISTTNAPTPRLGHTAVWTGSKMIIWGGIDATGLVNTGGMYDPSTDTWTAMATFEAPGPRFNHTAIWDGSKMIVWGGWAPPPFPPDFYVELSDGFAFDPLTNKWMPGQISNNSALRARAYPTAVWVPPLANNPNSGKMIIWGGETNHDPLGNPLPSPDYFATGYVGGNYYPKLDSWDTFVTSNGQPAPRAEHTAVFTGSEMIIWGGTSTGGGRYNPSTDTWSTTAMATAGATVRTKASAIWTGHRMIVWGGDLNTGDIYDPVLNQWVGHTILTDLAPYFNAPPPRISHTAVWTGSEMIIWGGFEHVGNYYGFVNTGWRYLDNTQVGIGTHVGHITITDPNATNNPQVITVTFTIP